ncbi:MAG: hypothetical protein Q7S86_01985 [bacterium]|nr:hypothetical protein [bacterium]
MSNLQTTLSRAIAAALFTAVIAGTWDVWWHGALGRESFFSPPHILLYVSVLVAISFGIYGWYKTREKLWKRLGVFLALVPLSAPFDELWHRTFGVEVLSSPLIVWSPPHLMIILSIVGSLFMLLPILKREDDKAIRQLFGALCFAAVFNLLLFLAAPLDPIGPYRLLGFWGVGFAAAIYTGILLSVKKWMPYVGTGILFVAFSCLLMSIGSGEQTASSLVVAPHAHAPGWLQMFALIIPALVIEFLLQVPQWIRGALIGFLYSAILYVFAREFIEPAFQYSSSSIYIAIITSIVGGVAVSFIVRKGSD